MKWTVVQRNRHKGHVHGQTEKNNGNKCENVNNRQQKQTDKLLIIDNKNRQTEMHNLINRFNRTSDIKKERKITAKVL